MKIDSLRETLSNRRGFTKSVGMASAGLAAFLANAETASAAVTDTDIVQFALNLEYLEAEFYTMAMTGQTLSQTSVGITGSGNAGATTGGNKVVMTAGSSLNVSGMQIMQDEQNHVTLLRGLLTGLNITPIAKPAINLNALGTGFESQEAFIALARAFEDVGVSAYGGAAPLIQNTTILGYAARILAVEAQHTGNLRLHAALFLAPTKPVDSQDILPPPSGTQYFSDNAQALSIVRTPGQVLSIVYGSNPNGATSGGFFPNGVNGSINTSST
ncbi:MAG: ferritin-like domain-containing protein [Acidobacteriota bacterium]|nr:ferritin-like domain-containing protein [Acidobacteriota bacterium]